MPDVFPIEVFADIACPWCYVGEARLFRALERARAAHPGVDFQPRWQPYQLQPQLPPKGLPWREFAEMKFGGWQRALAGFRHVERAAQEDGIAFDFEHIATAANTADAHRLILWAREQDKEWPMAHALFDAYFNGSKNLNDPNDLAATAEAAGLDADTARAFLITDAQHASVADSQDRAARLGITGVPFFIIGNQYAFSGAQPQDVFTQAFTKALEAQRSA